MKSLYIALIAFLFSFSKSAKADDVLIPFGQNLPGSPAWKYKGGGTNLDLIAWKDLLFTETGWVTGSSALGFGGGPVRNTSIPEDASTGGGGFPAGRYPTLYFRKTINIPSLAGYANFQLRTQFDDAIVVWINGVEAYRNNVSANPSYNTWSTGAIANNGNDIFTASLNNSLFVAGDNIIAVEIHQVSAGSTDLFFDLELTGLSSPPPSSDVVIFPFGENLNSTGWHYKGGGTNLDGILWKNLAYAEPGWVTGNSALGFGATPPAHSTAIPENTSAGGGGPSGGRYPTLYFRKIVNIADPNIYAGFKISSKFDDGIVVWVNGVQAYRNNVVANPVYADWALTGMANNGADIYTTTVAANMFNAGDNIIAVEIHQNAVNSSDLFFDMELTALTSITATLLRGPYLQVGNQNSIVIRWRTDVPTTSRVTAGTVFGNYTESVDSTEFTTEHIVQLNGLNADTKYYYTIGSTVATLQATANNFFTTLPPSNTSRKIKVLAFGDCANNSTNQADVRNAFLSYAATNSINLDAWILLGDNGYNAGLDAEYSTNFFGVYNNSLLKNVKLYPATGNHDYGNDGTNQGLRDLPYFQTFSMPQNGEIGGEPSHTQAYYSFNIGDIHFLALDSYGRENGNTTRLYDTAIGNRQADWLRADLAANTKKWTVAYFHHPPYTKTSHNSDTEGELVAVRENLIRILERNGVDMVVCGHAHGYERSYLLKGFYNTIASPMLDGNFNAALHTGTGNMRNARYDGGTDSCAYTYNSGKYNHGTMYIVAGSAGQIGGSADGYPNNCMYYSNNSNGGSFYFEVDSNRLNAKFISYTGTGGSVVPAIRDQFTIFKDVNKTQNFNVPTNAPLTLTASWRGTYYWPNNGGATTQSITINNPANGTFNYVVRDRSSSSCLQDVFNVTVSGTLPVTISSFTAVLNKDVVLLDWATSQEQQNKYFTIERSNDGSSFNFLGRVNGAGTSAISNAYHLIDYTPAEGINYYRLSQTDIDGNVKYFEVRKVNYRSSKAFSANIFNNGNGRINVAIHSTKATNINLKVIDMLGKEVLQETFSVNNGGGSKALDLNPGVYVLVMFNDNGERISNKIIVR